MTKMELFTALGGISAELLAGAEDMQEKPCILPKPKMKRKRLVLVAAIAALLLLLVGCGAAYIITRNLGWSKELEQDLRPYNEDTDIGAASKNWFLDEAMLTFSADPPENGSIKITCSEWSLNAKGTLDIGTEYWIEKWNGTSYEEIPTQDSQPWIVPEQSVTCGSDSSWTVNYLEKYGELGPGNYRVGMMVSKATGNGAPSQLGCFAKFRIPEPNMAPYLEAYTKAFQALKNGDAYHIFYTSYDSRITPNPEFQASREEIWKSGNDWAECLVIQELNAENFNDIGVGQMRRDGIGYGVDWPTGRVSDKPTDWMRLTFVDAFEPDLWCTFFEFVDRHAVDVQSTEDYVSIVESMGEEYEEVRVFYQEDGSIRRLEYAHIPGPAYEEADRVLWTAVEVLPTTAQEAAAVLRAIDLTTPSQFSYQEDMQQLDGSGYVQKAENFKNTTPQGALTIDSATRLASSEIPVEKTNISSVFYDQTAKIWKVEFSYSQDDNIYYAVYLDDTGVTQLVVSR